VVVDVTRAKEILSEVLKRMELDVNVESVDSEDRLTLDVKGAETALVIGKKGATLDALQYLVSKILYRGAEGTPAGKPVVIDAEGYRARREDTLTELALRLAEKAVKSQKPVVVQNAMNPHERRVIHLALDKVPGVTTRSEGEGIHRRLVVIPAPDKQ
jgi:spoIIIJ-associated protein